MNELRRAIDFERSQPINDNTKPVPELRREATWHEVESRPVSFRERIAQLRWYDAPAFVYILPLYLPIYLYDYYQGVPFVAFIAFMMSASLIQRKKKWLRRERAPTSFEPFLDKPSGAPQFPVGVSFQRDGTTYGSDSGVLTVMRGGIHFTGQKTDFTLTSKRSSVLVKFVGNKKASVPEEFSIWYSSERGDGVVTVSAYSKLDGEGHNLRAEMFESLRDWESAPSVERWPETIEPPRSADPTYLRTIERTIRLSTVAGGLFLLAAALLYLAKPGPGFSQVAIVIGLPSIAISVSCRRQLRKLRAF